MQKASGTGQVAGLLTSLDVNAPQLDVTIDRTQAMSQGVRLADIFEALQVYLGSLYVNDFNRFGRTYKVTAQATACKLKPSDVCKFAMRPGKCCRYRHWSPLRQVLARIA